MKEINTLDELIEQVSALTDSTDIKVIYTKEPSFTKKGRESKQLLTENFVNLHSQKIFKKSEIYGSLVFDYRTVLNRKMNELGIVMGNYPESPKKEPWHESYSKNGSIRVHKFTRDPYLYLLLDETIVTPEPVYITEANEIVEESELTEFLPKDSEDNDVVKVRLLSLGNIQEIQSKNFHYKR